MPKVNICEYNQTLTTLHFITKESLKAFVILQINLWESNWSLSDLSGPGHKISFGILNRKHFNMYRTYLLIIGKDGKKDINHVQ